MTVHHQRDANVPARWLLLAAFGAIYFIWGSSYVGMHFAVETIPPFIMGGVRFSVSGLVMMAWALTHGAAKPSRANWRATAIAGFFMFLVNNGALIWAATVVPSGMLSLLIAATPMWMVFLDWWRPSMHGRQAGGVRPTTSVFVGLLLGFTGILLLVEPGQVAANGQSLSFAVAIVLTGTVAWAAGSLYTRTAAMPESPILCTGMQLFTGGVMLLVLSVVSGQTASFHVADVAPRSWFALVYLMCFGSIIGFGSYVWLLRVAPPARIATYAYVNPVVAVFLGWLLVGETISLRTVIAAVVIIAAVMLVNASRHRRTHAPTIVLTEAVGETGA